MKQIALKGSLLMLSLAFLFASCEKSVPEEVSKTGKETTATQSAAAQKAMDQFLKSVRNATSRFHSTNQAIKSGYEPSHHCVSHPQLGGMGYHWVNPSLVDPVYDPLKPEAILYAKGADGELKIIGVEYIVINVGQPAPVFGSQPFDVGGTPIPAPHWSLHVWLYEENPSGMFAPFNPNVGCQ